MLGLFSNDVLIRQRDGNRPGHRVPHVIGIGCCIPIQEGIFMCVLYVYILLLHSAHREPIPTFYGHKVKPNTPPL